MSFTEADFVKKIPTLTLPDGRIVSLVTNVGQHPRLTEDGFSKLSSRLQKQAVRLVEDFLQECYATFSFHKGQLRRRPSGDTRSLMESVAKYLRYSTPTRIVEAIPPLTFITEAYKQHNNQKVTVVPTLYLGVALSKVEGEENRAINVFNEGLANLYGPQPPALNQLWARANYARMLRKLDRIKEAEEQERLTREWILGHWQDSPPSKIIDSIADELGTGTNILNHSDIVAHFADINELDTTHWVYKRKFLITKLA